MTTDELFDSTNIEIFMPEGVEFISSILSGLGYNYLDESTESARQHGLETIEKLLDLDLIEVYHWGEYDKSLRGKVIPKFKTMKYIAELWHNGAKMPDFYGMPMFKFKDWYIEALKNKGFTSSTNWRTFVRERIGNLETWIEENRPKS
ncbi:MULTISPECIES: hypothetical protein [Flavobacteriaceae]|uniref:hypothetical protein n=1 Tax=Flavobacteriaceae TaxID=49546 RepID=UPI002349E5CE|nr:hypothetical protein [Muricauda sp. SP22]MDC6363514.1 hypothetical protein [Muricauda sp. SP22]